jgi:hypothetical protein
MERTDKQKRKRLVGARLIFGILAVVGMGLLWPRERLLTHMARPVLKLTPKTADTAWLSAHRLLIITTEQEMSMANAARDLGQGWKVSPSIHIDPRQTITLAEIEGPGAIQHIWNTVGRRVLPCAVPPLQSPAVCRSPYTARWRQGSGPLCRHLPRLAGKLDRLVGRD